MQMQGVRNRGPACRRYRLRCGESALPCRQILRNEAYMKVRRSDPAIAGQAQDERNAAGVGIPTAS